MDFAAIAAAIDGARRRRGSKGTAAAAAAPPPLSCCASDRLPPRAVNSLRDRIDQATSDMMLQPDWGLTMQIVDEINALRDPDACVPLESRAHTTFLGGDSRALARAHAQLGRGGARPAAVPDAQGATQGASYADLVRGAGQEHISPRAGGARH